ncbi:hypothetical protein [Bradyrhizobium yuanmingense]|uniref:hypothetical protein n=1 Tax=Bradyrhizobium yuanmingense TaxID=108015 RepID=UPI0018D26A6A|nr:hypothetical protein [Bradyrhizobium yuanmingense]
MFGDALPCATHQQIIWRDGEIELGHRMDANVSENPGFSCDSSLHPQRSDLVAPKTELR